MPARTALVITIGDVIETGPANSRHRRRRHVSNNANNNSTAASKQRIGSSSSKRLPSLNGHHCRRRQRQRSGNSRRSSISHSETSSIASSALSDFNDDDEEGGVFPSDSMKRRGGGAAVNNGVLEVNGTAAEGRRLRSQSESTEHEGPLSPRTRASAAKNHQRHSGELDEEVSFNDPLSLDDFKKEEDYSNGDAILPYQKPMPASKKKRKSSDEKFLEDNSDYYGIQVLPNKLRSSGESFPNSFLDFLQQANVVEVKSEMGNSLQQRRKQRHKSASELKNEDQQQQKCQNRRQRILSTNGLHAQQSRDESPGDPVESNKRSLRVDVERIKVDEANHLEDDHQNDEEEEEDDEEDESPKRSRNRTRSKAERSISNNSSSSPSPKRLRRARSELDKLLEAGSSSFHFETARQASSRICENGLGPIHVDVSEQSNSSHDDHVNAKVSTTRRRKDSVEEEPEEADVEEEEEEEEEEVEVEEEALPVRRGRPGRRKVLAIPDSATKSKKQMAVNKKKGGRRGNFRHRPLVLTKEDLLEGPAFIPPKHELLNKKKKKNVPSAAGKKAGLRDYLPRELFDGLKKRLAEVTGDCINVDDMTFSFEKTPINEGWFQTYSRQDQSDEILFYPETKWFPLPYEMPNTTFYPSKHGVKKRQLLLESSVNSSVNPSGTATPEEASSFAPLPPPPPVMRKFGSRRSLQQQESGSRGFTLQPSSVKALLRKDSKASSSTDSDCGGSTMQRRRSGILARLAPRTCSSLVSAAEFSRKSPRCHASTKALLTSAHSTEDEDVDVEDDAASIANRFLLQHDDECSNDSAVSASLVSKKFKVETTAQLVKLAASLDSLLTEHDPLLVTDREDEPDAPRERLLFLQKKKRRRRSSSSGKHHSKHSSAASATSTTTPEDPMDRLVAANVDPVLLDCLEDELPSVTIDEEVPGSDPLELIATFEQCQSMAKCSNVRWARVKSGNFTAADLAHAVTSGSRRHQLPGDSSRLSMVPLEKSRRDDDSSSECATSACEESGGSSVSGASSTSGKGRKKKRNLTGFPSVKRKKKKSLLNDVLTRASGRTLRDQNNDEEESDLEVANMHLPPPPARKKRLLTPTKKKTVGMRPIRVPVTKKYKEPEESDEEEEEKVEDDDDDSEEEDEEAADASDDAESGEEDEDSEDEEESDEDESEDEESDSESAPVVKSLPKRNKTQRKAVVRKGKNTKAASIARKKKRSSSRVTRARN